MQTIVKIIACTVDLTVITILIRMQLNMEQIAHEMKVIADSGMEEILILTGESRAKSDVKYIGEACKLARKVFPHGRS